MKRFRAASALLLAIFMVFGNLSIPTASAKTCTDNAGNTFTVPDEQPCPTFPAPTAPAPTAPAPAPTGPTPPPGGCGINTFWNGNSCAPNAPAPTGPTPPPGGCGPNTAWNGTFCAPTTTTPTAPSSDCPVAGQVKDASGACYFPTTTTTTPTFNPSPPPGGCGPTQGWNGFSCETPTTNTSVSTSPCQFAQQVRDATGACNFPPGITASNTTCSTTQVLIGGVCVSNQTLPTCTATQSSNCVPDSNSNTQFNCPVNGQVRDASGACYFPTTTTTTSTNKYDCSTAALKILDVCGGTTKANLPTCSSNQRLEGLNCVSNTSTTGVFAQSANIKCSDGTFRNTAIECEQSVGGKSTVAITCPSNQVVSPSGAYCIYPTTTGTAQGTYRSECAVTPLPASCLVGAPTTFEGATQMAQKATFNQVLTTELKIQGNNAFDAAGVKVGELAKASNGQVFQAAAPPPPPSSTAGGKAAPKKTTKSSAAPVIVMNVLGADNKEILGPDGKPLQTAPIVKQGNFVYTDSNGSPIMATPCLNAAGEAVVHNGKVLMTRLMTVGGNEAMLDASGKPIMMVPLLGDDGKPLLAPNGEVLYAPPLVNAGGKTMISASTGQAILARPMADSSGDAALGADKKPFMGQPILTRDSKLLTVGGQEIYTGAVGMPLTNSKKQQVRTANKQDVQFGFGGTLIDEGGNPVLGPDGKAIVMNANATPLMSNGLPLLDKNGKAVRVTANGQITDSSGRVILGIDGKAIAIGKSESADVMKIGSVLKSTVKAPDGSVAVMALNAQLFDKSGNPIVTASGQPIFFDAKSKKLIDNKGNAVKVEAGGKIVGKIVSLAFQTVNFAA